MTRFRALAFAIVAFAALVGVGALAVIFEQSGDNASLEASQGEPMTANPASMVFWSDPQWAMVSFRDRNGDSRLRAYAADGSPAWDVPGIQSAIPAGPFEAIGVIPGAGDESGHQEPATLVRVARDGQLTEVAAAKGDLWLAWADSDDIVCVETLRGEAGPPQSRVVTYTGSNARETPIPGGGYAAGVGVSADGCRLAVTTAKADGNLLSWYARSPGQDWELVNQKPKSAFYLALSPDGERAILSCEPPELPVVVAYGQAEGSALPFEHVSEARFGPSRLVLRDYRIENNNPLSTVSVVSSESYRVEWSRQFDDDQRVASDAEVSSLAYLESGGRQVVVVDLSSGEEKRFSVEPADDVGFLDADHVLVALQGGSVSILPIGDEQ